MQNDLQRFLDGELARDELSPDSLREAERFELWTRTAVAVQPDHAPVWLENRIMVSLPTGPNDPFLTRFLSWILETRRIRIRPLPVGLAGAAALGLAILLPRGEAAPPDPTSAVTNVLPVSSNNQVYLVQFVLVASEARSVAVAGDFNNWQPGIQLRDSDGDGVWTAMVPLRAGFHKYMFLVDDEQWVTDPRAERYLDDGYGNRNAVITVAPVPARAL